MYQRTNKGKLQGTPSDLFKDVCTRCTHRATCKAPCAPVAEDLKAVTSKYAFEVERRDEGGRLVDVKVWLDPREKNFATINGLLEHVSEHEDDYFPAKIDADGSREFWQAAHVGHKTTGIFIDRVFNKWSFADIAVKYNCSESAAQTMFQNALKRVQDVVVVLDSNIYGLGKSVVEKNQEREAPLSKTTMAFLMFKCLGLTYRQTARLLDTTPKTVCNYVGRVVKRVAEGGR